MYRYKEDKTLVSADTSETSGLSMLPAPNITRKRLGPQSKRKMRSTLLLRSGFVLLTMVFAYVFLSPKSPLHLSDDDNHGQGFRSEPSMSQAHLHRRLLTDEEEVTAPAPAPFIPPNG